MLNRTVLMGRLVADPELRKTQSGLPVTQFRLAVERNYTPKGEERQADFINIVAWRNTADFVCRYFQKGQLMALEGSIQTRNYTDKQGGNRTAFEVIADQVYFAGQRDAAPNKRPVAGQDNSRDGPRLPAGADDDFEEIDVDDGELPF